MKKFIKSVFNYFQVSFCKLESITISAILIAFSTLVIGQNWINGDLPKFPYFGKLIFILSIIVFAIWIYETGIFSLRKIKKVNELDVFLSSSFYVLLVVAYVSSFSNRLLKNVLIAASVLILFLIIIRIKQIYYLNPNSKSSLEVVESRDPLVDLKDLYKGSIVQNENKEILVDERKAAYDLFGRDNIIKQLAEAMRHQTVDHSYVIGLTGVWGSGKSTILNLAKDKNAKEEADIIDLINESDFDLWLFDSKEELIKEMYNCFLSGLGIKYRSALTNKLINSASKLLAGVTTNGVQDLFLDTDSYQDVYKLRNRLTDYIKSTGKHYVMSIENLDRAKDEQIVLLLKLIISIFDIPNVTFVLLYDRDRLKEVFKNQRISNLTFAEKVINQEIQIPEAIDSNVCQTCLNNLLSSYGIDLTSQQEIKDMQLVNETIISNMTNVRDLKRIINSVYTILANRDTLRLYIPQVIAIQYLHFKDPKIYEEIRQNKKMLARTQSFLTLYNSNFSAQEKKKIDRFICDKDENWVNLLEMMFPVITYAESNTITTTFYDHESRKETRINSTQYFDCYFNLEENSQVNVNYLVKKLLKDINGVIAENTISNIKSIVYLYWRSFLVESSNIKDSAFSELSLFTDREDIKVSLIRKVLSEVIFKDAMDDSKYNKYNKEQLLFIVSKLIKELNETDFDEFLSKEFEGQYYLLPQIEFINRAINESYGGISEDLARNEKTIKLFFTNMCKEIVDNNVDIFDDKIYSHQISFSIFRGMLENEISSESVDIYLLRIINHQNVFNFFKEFVSSDDSHNFNINTIEEISKKLPGLPYIINICKDAEPQNDNQKRIKEFVLDYANKK